MKKNLLKVALAITVSLGSLTTIAQADQLSLSGGNYYSPSANAVDFYDYAVVTYADGFFADLYNSATPNLLSGDALDLASFTYSDAGVLSFLSGATVWEIEYNGKTYTFTYDSGSASESVTGNNTNLNVAINGTLSIYDGSTTSEIDGVLNLTTQSINGVTTVSWSSTTAAVPEPATMLLFGTGIAGLAGIARRKN